jgi:hypothetical protein
MIDEMEFNDGTDINTYSQFGATTVEK